jgi:hypothetical protein
VAKLDPTSLQTEERGVATLLLWGLAHNRDLKSLTSGNLILQSDHLGRDVISRSLDKHGALRPGGLAVVAHPPGLAENGANEHLVFVRETFFDKAGRVAHILWFNLGRLRIPLPRVNISRLGLGLLSLGSSWLLVSIELVALVLADDLLRSLFDFSDLDHGVLAARNTILFAGFTEVSVRTDRAHITDSLNRVGITSVTDDFFMDNLALLLLLFLDVVEEHVAESFLTVILDLLAHDRCYSGELLRDKSALSIALAAGESLLVDLGAVTLDASNLLKVIFVII